MDYNGIINVLPSGIMDNYLVYNLMAHLNWDYMVWDNPLVNVYTLQTGKSPF